MNKDTFSKKAEALRRALELQNFNSATNRPAYAWVMSDKQRMPQSSSGCWPKSSD